MRILKRQGPESRPLSDASKLVWSQFHSPMQSAAAQLNVAIAAAQNVVAGAIIRAEGLSAEEWVFNMDTLRLVRRPPEKGV